VDPELLGSPDTVALLARALRAVPDAPDHLDALSELVNPIDQASSALDAAISDDETAVPASLPDTEVSFPTEDQPALEW
jgi:hypothetical protein